MRDTVNQEQQEGMRRKETTVKATQQERETQCSHVPCSSESEGLLRSRAPCLLAPGRTEREELSVRLGSTFQQQETRDLPYYPVLFLTIPVTCGYHHAQVTGLACGYYHAQAFGSPAGITTLRSPASTVDKYLYGNFSFVRCLEVLTHQTAAISLFFQKPGSPDASDCRAFPFLQC